MEKNNLSERDSIPVEPDDNLAAVAFDVSGDYDPMDGLCADGDGADDASIREPSIGDPVPPTVVTDSEIITLPAKLRTALSRRVWKRWTVKGGSPTDLSLASGIPENALRAIIAGESLFIEAQHLSALADALSATPHNLLGFTNELPWTIEQLRIEVFDTEGVFRLYDPVNQRILALFYEEEKQC